MLSRNKVAVPEGAAGSPPFKRSSWKGIEQCSPLSVVDGDREASAPENEEFSSVLAHEVL